VNEPGTSDGGSPASEQARVGVSVWVENTAYGDAEVMVLNLAIDERPFCYCSFHYRAGYTDAGIVHQAAERMAMELGAEAPVRFVARFEC